MPSYKAIKSRELSDLEITVRSYVELGWWPVGGVSAVKASFQNYVIYIQAIVWDKAEEPKLPAPKKPKDLRDRIKDAARK